MTTEGNIKNAQLALACLEATPPDWLGAAMNIFMVYKNYEYKLLISRFEKRLQQRAEFQVPDALKQQMWKLQHSQRVPGGNVQQDQLPFQFVYGVQMDGYRQELVDVLRGLAAQTDQAALLAENAALRAKVMSMEDAVRAALGKP